MSALRDQWLECVTCASRFAFGPMLRGCPRCADPSALEVRYDYATARAVRDTSAPGLWQWKSLLPAFSNPVSLHEGRTPLVPYPIDGTGIRLLIKNETQNPTWSWKDRANSLSASAARHFGYAGMVTVSTGNHGNAAAAYSTAAGLRCRVLCNAAAPSIQLQLMRHYGAETIVGGDQDAQLSAILTAEVGWFPGIVICPRTGHANPFGVEGFKTIAFEIVEQLGRAPDRVFVPTGSGDGLYGVAKGFRELVLTGAIERSPRMICCQTVQANPFVRAFREGRRRLTPLVAGPSIALSIAEEIGDQVALQAIYDSGGEALDVEESDIQHAVGLLARRGLAFEPSSAAALACALAHPHLQSEETWVVIGTGTAIRWPESFRGRGGIGE